MTAPVAPTYLCPNGHGGPTFASARFCPQCGAAFAPVAPNYAPPNGGFALPNTGAVPPAQGYAPPSTGYQPPSTGYAPPVQGYQPSAPGYAPPVVGPAVTVCSACGGDGTRLDSAQLVCPQCRWLRPLTPGYTVHPSAFQWGADSAAMAKLRSVGPLNTLARTVSDRVGRRWIESSFNAILLGTNQLPDIYALSVRAAQLMGMPFMPDVYVSGDKMWDAVTYGSDHSAFLLVGTALINNYKGDDLLFLLAREMGHCRAGHALWKTVGELLTGQQGPHKGVLAEGIIGAVGNAINPTKLVENAVMVPFLAWARQAEITADRAGMLAIGDEEVARRVLLSWSLRSVPLYKQINTEAWLQQQEDSDDQMTRMSEMLNSSTPYITRRLKLLTQFSQSPELAQMRGVIGPLVASLPPLTPPAPAATPKPPPKPAPAATPTPAVQKAAPTAEKPAPPPGAAPKPPAAADAMRVTCSGCGTVLRVPKDKFTGKDVLRVKCPKPECGKVLTLQKKPPAPAPAASTPDATPSPVRPATDPTQAGPPSPSVQVTPAPGQAPPPPVSPAAPVAGDLLRVTCSACEGVVMVPFADLVGKDTYEVRCPNPACGKIIALHKKS